MKIEKVHSPQPKRVAKKNQKQKVGIALPLSDVWVPLLLALVAFLVYWPSLKSDFVYDARQEILVEGFITSPANLVDVLSFKVLGMNLMLGDRPGQLLYLMVQAALFGKSPWGYHLSSNLLHATNVALLFVFMRRLVEQEVMKPGQKNGLKVQLALVSVSLIFALHPIATEPVSGVSFSSDLLATLFVLLALLAATAFHPEKPQTTVPMGGAGIFCAFAAVTCKESGLAAAALLIVYWFLFRREEAKGPWFCFLGCAMAVTAIFLAARFQFAPSTPDIVSYLGGSLSQVFLIQPRLWVFMMGKLCWPAQFSADYTLENVSGLMASMAWAILIVVVLLQGWLATRSRIGAMGVAVYWLGLATVSNFMPLYRILADRFYYLPLAGVALQLLALLLIMLRTRYGFWMMIVPLFGALLPLTQLSLNREEVFASDYSLWSDTLRVSPFSWLAHSNLAVALQAKGEDDEALAEFQKALAINPDFAQDYVELSNIYLEKGRADDAIVACRKALDLVPKFARAHYNLGIALAQKGQVDEAMTEFRKALVIDPSFGEADGNLGNALLQTGRVDEAMAEFQRALALDPNHAEVHNSYGVAFLQKGQVDEAIAQFQSALKINPNYAKAHCNLGSTFAQKGQMEEAIAEFQKAVAIKPDLAEARTDLGNALLQKGELDAAIVQLQEALRLNPDDSNAQRDLVEAQGMARQTHGSK